MLLTDKIKEAILDGADHPRLERRNGELILKATSVIIEVRPDAAGTNTIVLTLCGGGVPIAIYTFPEYRVGYTISSITGINIEVPLKITSW